MKIFVWRKWAGNIEIDLDVQDPLVKLGNLGLKDIHAMIMWRKNITNNWLVQTCDKYW